jgi:hypothetical protein
LPREELDNKQYTGRFVLKKHTQWVQKFMESNENCIKYGSPKVAAVLKTASQIWMHKLIGGDLGDKTYTNGFAIEKYAR